MEISPKTILVIVLTGLTLWMIGQLVAVITTVVFAFILVGTLNPAVKWLENFHIKRIWAVALVFLGCALIVTLISLLIAPALWDQAAEIASNLPKLQASIATVLSSHKLTSPLASTVRNFGAGKLASNVSVASTATLSLAVIEVIGYAATSLVLAIYFMADMENIRGGLYALVPRSYHIRLARILLNLEPIVGGYMRGQLLTSLAIGVFTATLLYACRVPNALSLAFFASLTDVFPFVGGLLAITPAFLSALPRGLVVSVVVLFSMLVYQEFESRVIVPRVYGKSLRLSSAMVVIALLVGGKLGGIVGALLALPFTAAIKMIMEELRIDLPGRTNDDETLRKLDEKAETTYAEKSAGVSTIEAGAVASKIARKVLKEEEKNPN